MKIRLTGIILLAIMALSAVFAQGCMVNCEFMDPEAFQALVDKDINLTNERDKLQKQLEEQRAALATLQAQQSDVEAETLAVNSDIASTEDELDDLQNQSDNNQATMDSIDSQIADKQAEITSAEERLQEVETELEEVQGRLSAVLDFSWCFDGDTLVLMADGSMKKIKDIEPGEAVLSYDAATDTIIAGDVIDTASGQADYYYLVNGNLKVVPPHPFLTSEGQWVAVEDLQVGDIIMSNSGTTEITSIGMVEGELEIYNICVEDYHNFYVSADGQDFYLAREQ